MHIESAISYIIVIITIGLISYLRYRNSALQLGILLFLLPSYLIRFNIFQIPTNALEVMLLVFVSLNLLEIYYSKQNVIFSHLRKFIVSRTLFIASTASIILGAALSTAVSVNILNSAAIVRSWIALPIAFTISFLLLQPSIKYRAVSYVPLSLVGLGVWLSFEALVVFFLGHTTYDGRLSGLFQSPNQLAFLLSPAFLSALWLWYSNRRVHYIFSAALIFVALGLTFSHGAWISVLVAVFAASVNQLGKSSLFRFLPVALLTASIILSSLLPLFQETKLLNFANQSDSSSLASRSTIWSVAGHIAYDNPLYGIGPGQFQNKYLEYQKHYPPYLEWAVPQPHNTYWAFYLQVGVLGLIGFFTILIHLAIQLKNKKTWFIHALFFYFLIHSTVDTLFWKNDLSIFFWIMTLLIYVPTVRSSMNKL